MFDCLRIILPCKQITGEQKMNAINQIFLNKNFPLEFYEILSADDRFSIEIKDFENVVSSQILTEEEIWDEIEKIKGLL